MSRVSAICVIVLLAFSAIARADGTVVVDKMNSDAFYEFRSVPMEGPYPAVVLSPILRWNTAVVVSMGSNDTPSVQEQDGARAFMSAFSAAPGRRIATRVWVRKDDTSYTFEDAAALEKLFPASTIALPPRDSDADADLDQRIARWASEQSTKADAGEDLVTGLNSTRAAKDRISHPFNVATVVSQTAQFDHPLPPNGKPVSLPSYDASGLRGIRIDSRASKLSLYLFYGDSKSISDVHSRLTTAVWNDITSRFRTRVVKAPLLPLSVTERWKFRLPEYYKAYGTYMSEPGTENLTLDIDRTGMALDAAAAIEGYAAPDTRLDSLRLAQKRASVSPDQSVLFALVDCATGAIVVLGANTAP